MKSEFNKRRYLTFFLIAGAIFVLLGGFIMITSFREEAAFTIVDSDLKMKVGESQTLQLEYEPENAPKPELTFYSSNNSVATVNEVGVVSAKRAGSCEITCAAPDGEEESLKVKVNYRKPKKTIYLTFEDGPAKEATPAVLDVLNKYDAKATFFVIGLQAEVTPEILKRIVLEGHTVGIHTYSNDYNEIYESKDAYLKDFDKAEKVIRDITGYECQYWRFPGGGNNDIMGTETTRSVMRALHKRGYTEIDWNSYTDDAVGVEMTTKEMVDRGIATIDIHPVPIVLIHDASTNSKAAEITEGILKHYKDKGYKFKGLNDYTGPELTIGE